MRLKITLTSGECLEIFTKADVRVDEDGQSCRIHVATFPFDAHLIQSIRSITAEDLSQPAFPERWEIYDLACTLFEGAFMSGRRT